MEHVYYRNVNVNQYSNTYDICVLIDRNVFVNQYNNTQGLCSTFIHWGFQFPFYNWNCPLAAISKQQERKVPLSLN